MKGPRELKRYVSIMRHHMGRGNGVIPGYAFDDLKIFKLERCKKWKRDNKPSDVQMRGWDNQVRAGK